MNTNILLDISQHASNIYRLFAKRNIHMSASSGLAARLTALALNGIGVPILLSALGAEQYGSLMVLSGIAAWISLGSFGLNGSVTSEVARDRNNDDQVARILISGFYVTAVLATAVSAVATLAVAGAFKWGWFGLVDAWNWPGVYACSAFLLVVSFVQLLLSPFEAAQLGRQLSWISNLLRASGNLLACLLVFAFLFFQHTMFNAAVALFLPPTLAMLANASTFIPLLSKHRRHFFICSFGQVLSTLRKSLPFFIISLHGLSISTFTTIYVSAFAGPTEAATTSVFFRIIVIAMSIPTLITSSLWAAIVEARHQSDHAWIRKTTTAIFGPILIGALVFCLVFAAFGGGFVNVWTGGLVHFAPQVPAFCAAVIFMILWNHLWSTLLMGLDRQNLVAKVQVIEIVVICTLGAFWIPSEGTLGMFKAMLVGTVLCSGINFPVFAIVKFRAFIRTNKF